MGANGASSPSAGLTKPFWRAGETNFPGAENFLKPTAPIKDPDQQRSSIMWALIIDLVYGQCCERYLADMLKHQHRWI